MLRYYQYQIKLNTLVNRLDILSILFEIGNPILNSVKNDILRIFCGQQQDKKVYNQEFEIISVKDTLCLVDLKDTNSIKLSFIGLDMSYQEVVNKIKETIEQYLKSKQIDFQIVEDKKHFKPFVGIDPSSLKNNSIYNQITNQRYQILKSISNLGTKVYKSDVFNSLRIQSETIEELININLLQREYVFICRQNNRQIIQLSNLEVLRNNPDAVKCFYCGKSLKDEIMEEIISLSAESNEIISDNIWLVSIIYNSLVSTQIDDVVIDSIDFAKAIICNHLYEPVVILVLKEDFRLHDVFLLELYLSNYKSKYIIFVSLSPKVYLVRDYFSIRGVSGLVINSYENIGDLIINAVSEISWLFVMDKLRQYENYFSFRISDLLVGEGKNMF
ncbi:MAG: hypothetical protein ABDH21_00365 [bacterium]